MDLEIEFSRELTDWLMEAVGDSEPPLQIKPMLGAASSSVNLLLRNDQPCYVLRIHTNREWLLREPDLIAHEAAVLKWMSGADLPIPCCVATRESDPQALLMTLLPGKVILQPPDINKWLKSLAHTLAQIHRHPAIGFPWQYRSWTRLDRVAVPGWSRAPGGWQIALDRCKLAPPAFAPVFIHRDFHPLNVLWQDGRVSGVVDWVNGCAGPAAVDVAHCRLNLALMYGEQFADRFLEFYQATCPGYEHNPYWDMDAVLGWLPEPFFYEPWGHFGLPRIADEELSRRMDSYLLSVVSGLG